MLDTRGIFDRYEEVRHRFPGVPATRRTETIDSLLDVAGNLDAFVFDAFGVLNVGETPIPGAADRVRELRRRGCRIRVLSNAASYDKRGALAKFVRLGVELEQAEIVTSRDAAWKHVDERRWGVITADADALNDSVGELIRLGDDAADYDRVEGFLFLSTANWTDRRQSLLEASLRGSPKLLVIGNADIAAPRDNGFSLEPGYYGHRIADSIETSVVFCGKPYPEAYRLVEETLPGVPPARIAMCGDTLHTDILGAEARGWRTVLVTRDGLFAGHDVTAFAQAAGIHADWQLGRI